jgi:predicted P-loop ATPase
MESHYGIKNPEKVMHSLTIVTNQNKFNPITDFLNSLKWDGQKHIENLLPDYLGVEKNEYSIECMKMFMMGAISRAFNPGTKFDFMPVFVGQQGIGKSTFYSLLACEDDWYHDNFKTIEGDKATEQLRGKWIIEFAELLAVKRAQDVESIKAFITSTNDIYRPPYGRRTETRPRQCVFVGSTNNTHFLTDTTGNRRYLPITVQPSRVKKSLFVLDAREDFRQAWAEAMEIYRSGNFQLIFPNHLKDAVTDAQSSYLEEDSRVGIIQEYLDKLKDDDVCVTQIYKKALGNEYGNPNRKESNEIHDIMQFSICGWEKTDKKKRFDTYGPQICYHRIEKNEDVFINVDTSDSDLPFN